MGGVGLSRVRPGFRAAKSALKNQLWRSVLGLADDVTTSSASRSCLVLAPHQDDETLGCGATILRKTDAGTAVWVVYATDGRHSHRSRYLGPSELADLRRRESLEACRRLGVPPNRVVHLDLAEGELETRRDELTDAIAKLWRAIEPEEVLVSSGLDGHPDHRVLHESAVEVLSSRKVSGELLEYPVWFWMKPWWRTWLKASGRRACGLSWPAAGAQRGVRPRVVRTRGYLRRKHHALQAHASQLRNLTGEPGWLTLHDVARGEFVPRFFDAYEAFFPLQRQEV